MNLESESKSNMNLSNSFDFPKPDDFLKLEHETLKKMLGIREIQFCYPLFQSIQQAIGMLNSRGYNFFCILNIKNDPNFGEGKAEISIGAKVTIGQNNKYKSVSYSTSLILKNRTYNDTDCHGHCFKNQRLNGVVKPRIVRRFHFDYDTGDLEDHPMFHLHYGGAPEDLLEKNHYCLLAKLACPRIFFPPMNLALVFDLIIGEYNTVLGKGLLSKGDWKKIIRASEDIILKPYFKLCHEYFEKKGTRMIRPSFVHWHYGKKSCSRK